MQNVTTIKKLIKQAEAFEKASESLFKKALKKCRHPRAYVLEGEYEPAGTFGSADAPFRVCTLCGYAEEGWGCGYWKLNFNGADFTNIQLKRSSALKLVRDFWSQDRMNEKRFP